MFYYTIYIHYFSNSILQLSAMLPIFYFLKQILSQERFAVVTKIYLSLANILASLLIHYTPEIERDKIHKIFSTNLMINPEPDSECTSSFPKQENYGKQRVWPTQYEKRQIQNTSSNYKPHNLSTYQLNNLSTDKLKYQLKYCFNILIHNLK